MSNQTIPVQSSQVYEDLKHALSFSVGSEGFVELHPGDRSDFVWRMLELMEQYREVPEMQEA